MLRERVYVQTDKPSYIAGELIWIKLIITDANGNPLDLSKVAYVELLSEAGAQLQVKLELVNGVGEGWMELSATLATDSYRMVAYTRYMRNEGENVYFSKIVPIINTFSLDKAVELVADSSSLAPRPLLSISSAQLKTEKAHIPYVLPESSK